MKKIEDRIRENKAITLVSLMILVAILMIVTVTIAMNINTRYEAQQLDKLSSDLTLLKDKVLLYYTENGEYPIKEEPLQGGNEEEYEIELSRLEGLTLNYGSGKDGVDDIYVVHKLTGAISYKKGIDYKGEKIHSLNVDREMEQVEVSPVLKITKQMVEIQDADGNTKDTLTLAKSSEAVEVEKGNKVILTIETNLNKEEGVSYQWYKNDEKILEATNHNYEVTELEEGDSYYCETTYDKITKKSYKITLFIQ